MTDINESEKRRLRLLEEANALPETPGVYIMHDKTDRVIYVGKSRKLRNRVSQYFTNSEKNRKTERMTSSVYRFECVFCDTEIEALTLENVLIKKYSPRYNIKLKDAKSYPYIKITGGDWPVLRMSRQRSDDGGRYFGPYSSSATVFSVISQVNRIFRLPTCKRRFPQDIGKDRPCIYYQMGRCMGVCTGKISKTEYGATINSAAELLRGHTAPVRRELEERMMDFSEKEEFEAAARCRDAIKALDSLSQKQKAVAGPDTYQDAAGIFSDSAGEALSLLCIRGGALVSKFDYVVPPDVVDPAQAYITILAEHYRESGNLPRRLLLGDGFSDDDAELLTGLLTELAGKKTEAVIPQRGDGRKLCLMASENASQALLKDRRDIEKTEGIEAELAVALGLEILPERIESYDISNIGSEHITAGMIVVQNGRFSKKDYRTFTVKTTDGVDDYGALREVLERRFKHLADADKKSSEKSGLDIRPDLILLDGGLQHLNTALDVMEKSGEIIPVAGMVKDSNHRTRNLITRDGEIDIAKNRELFVFVYRIQEEVHRYSVGRMSAAKRRTVRHSSLEKIRGIGPAKASALIEHFGSMEAVRNASPETLAMVSGISVSDAAAVSAYFRSAEREKKK